MNSPNAKQILKELSKKVDKSIIMSERAIQTALTNMLPTSASKDINHTSYSNLYKIIMKVFNTNPYPMEKLKFHLISFLEIRQLSVEATKKKYCSDMAMHSFYSRSH
jgi:hypothetical protein